MAEQIDKISMKTCEEKNKSATLNNAKDSFSLLFTIEKKSTSQCALTVTVPATVIDIIYDIAARSMQRSSFLYGIYRGNVPLAYVKQNFKEHLIRHLQEFLFKYCIINFLYKSIREEKMLIAGDPRLTNIHLEPGKDGIFVFEATVLQGPAIYEWKFFPFKTPQRKNYKDLDRQVESFVKGEKDQLEKCDEHYQLSVGDWVNFDVTLADDEGTCTLAPLAQNFWFQIGKSETETPLREIFIDKKVGDGFFTKNKALQEFFSDQIETDYNFSITIRDALPNSFFCFENFKRHFRIKTNKDMHKKLIEAFSYRHDISQRRATVEGALKLLLSKHRFDVPQYLVLRQQKSILDAIQSNPDYTVYRAQKDFQMHVEQLAERQAREATFMDQFAYHENLNISGQDVKGYLNFMLRPRMKEFIYFTLPSFKREGQEVPIPTEEMKRICLREKAINHIIYHLTKK